MDVAIKKNKWGAKRWTSILGLLAAVSIVVFSVRLSKGGASIKVGKELVTISEVKKGPFRELIPVNGVVMPVATIYLDIAEGGRVEEKYVEDGAVVKKGDAIMKLTNTDLELSLVNEETAVFNLLTQMQISHNAARQNTISKMNQMADVDNAYTEAGRIYKMNKQLYAQKAISTQEYKQTEQAFEYQARRKKLTERIMGEDSVSVQVEREQALQGYKRMQEALALMKRKVGDLTIKAPVDGRITSLDGEIGQNKNKGDRIGQIDVLSGFKIRAEVDEHYISRIYTGLEGTCELGDKTYKLTVKKIYTQVNKGHFEVDMTFNDTLPESVKRGQTLRVKLALSDETQALLLPKGGYYQQTGGNWVFILSADGKTAHRADIQTGRQNPDNFEILQGLKPGDKVITSGYEQYEKVKEIIINN